MTDSAYPAALDTAVEIDGALSSATLQGGLPLSGQVTLARKGVVAVQAELGTTPSGSDATVKARFNRVESELPTTELRITDVDAYTLPALSATTWQTYDGSGQVVHPTVRYFPNAWNGYRWWAAITPYAGSNNQLENPSILVSEDGTTWAPPPGLTNPLVQPPVGGYNSDPHLVMGPDGVMHLFYRDYFGAEPSEHIKLMTSTDGVTWSAPVLVLANNQATRRVMSPAVWWDGAAGEWVMLGVEILADPRIVLRYTAPAATGPWTLDASPVSFTGSWGSGRSPWHMDAQCLGSQVVALIQDATTDGSTGHIYLAVSDDAGRTFTRAENPLVSANCYRSVLVPMLTQDGLAFDVFVGRLGATWSVERGTAAALPSTRAETAANLLLARAGVPPWIVGDTFARADNAALGNADSGQAWTSSAGAFRVTSKAAAPTTDVNTRSYVETGVADQWASAAFASAPDGTGRHWVIARLVDANNYYRVSAYPTSLELQKIVGGSVTSLATVGITPPVMGDVVGLRCVGTTLEVYINSVLITSVTDASLAGTKAGLQASKAATKFRNFTVREA